MNGCLHIFYLPLLVATIIQIVTPLLNRIINFQASF